MSVLLLPDRKASNGLLFDRQWARRVVPKRAEGGFNVAWGELGPKHQMKALVRVARMLASFKTLPV